MESQSDFPFHKLKYHKYLILDVMMYVDYKDVCKSMFKINTQARKFINDNFITVRNGFTNEGLIDFSFDNDASKQYNNYEKLEKMYYKILNQNICNRMLTINLV